MLLKCHDHLNLPEINATLHLAILAFLNRNKSRNRWIKA